MLYSFALFALFIALQLLLPISTAAQSSVRPRKIGSAHSDTRTQNRQVAVELERQQRFLRKVTARFEAVASQDVTPLLKYSYVWNALRENRDQLSVVERRLSTDQSKLLAKSYDALEKEVVATFGDHQLAILNEVLELNEIQFEEIQKAVEDDLNSRRDLLKTMGMSSSEFVKRLTAISTKTETQIIAALFPEQRKNFQRQVDFNRDRLIG